MPPKRKMLSNPIEDKHSKRHTRSSGPIPVESHIFTTTIGNSPKNKLPIRTYARTQRHGLVIHDSSEEIANQESLGKAAKKGGGLYGNGAESSEDELILTGVSVPPVLDAEATMRARGNAKRANVRSTRSNEKLRHPAGQPTPPTHPQIPQKTAKSVNPLAVKKPSTRLTRSPEKLTSQSKRPIRITNSVVVSNPTSHGVTRPTSIQPPDYMSITHRSAREQEEEQEIRSEILTPTEQRRRLSKRELEQGLSSPSLSPSSKKQKLSFDWHITSPPLNTISHPTFHTSSIASLHMDPDLLLASGLPLVNTQSQNPPFKRSPVKIHTPNILPPHLYSCLNAQKRAILRALQRSSDIHPNDEEEKDNYRADVGTTEVAFHQLRDLLNGTFNRGEGNSCLILGPRGSGKSKLVEQCLSNMPDNPIIVRLSGWTQHSDRIAMREIAYQLNHQAGTTILVHPDGVPRITDSGHSDYESNPFLEKSTPSLPMPSPSLPPFSHLPALISIIPTLPRPTVVILDGFDLFSLHPRQSLLYCLLDTAQTCRASTSSSGFAVIGITSRVDMINLLEKRVKSRFSGRIIRTAPSQKLEDWVKAIRATLMLSVIETNHEEDHNKEWKSLWDMAIEDFLSDVVVLNALSETFSITRDIRVLNRILVSLILDLTPSSPFPSASRFMSTILSQRVRPRLSFLHTLSYPALCLLIASVRVDIAGQSTFNFEMLHEYFHDQLRSSTSAPVKVNGGNIGMMRCSREVLMSAFEYLISIKVFVCIAPSTNVTKEFIKYYSLAAREDVKKAIDRTGQINLKKWLTKAQ